MKPEMTVHEDYCRDCDQVKPISDFPTAGSYCRKCSTIRTRNAPNYAANIRKGKLKKYGLTPEQYDEMNGKQNGLCAICSKPEITKSKVRLAVDHDHKTGYVRGLLCNTCNTALGKFYDNIELLKSAIWYLEKAEAEFDSQVRKIMTDNLEEN